MQAARRRTSAQYSRARIRTAEGVAQHYASIITKASFNYTGNHTHDVLTGRARTEEYPRDGFNIADINPSLDDVIRRNAGGVGSEIGMPPEAPWSMTADAKTLMHQWIVWVYMETCKQGARARTSHPHLAPRASHTHFAAAQPRSSCCARAPRRSRACTSTTS